MSRESPRKLEERLAAGGMAAEEELALRRDLLRAHADPAGGADAAARERNLRRMRELFQAAGAGSGIEDGLAHADVLRQLGAFHAAKRLLRLAHAQVERLEALVDAGDTSAVALPTEVEPGDGYPDEVARDMKAAQKDGDAAIRLAERFRAGRGMPVDPEAAEEWSKRAERLGGSFATALEGIKELGGGDLYFAPALKKVLPAARQGHGKARLALGLGTALPEACRKGIAFLGERGTASVVPLLVEYVEVVRQFAAAQPQEQRNALRPLVEALRDGLLANLRREGTNLPPDVAAACRNAADFNELEPPVPFTAIRALAGPG